MFIGRIEVVREDESRLKRAVWKFWYYDSDHTLYIDVYSEEERKSKRHSYKICDGRYYLRISHNTQYGNYMTKDDVPLPDDVVAEAREKFVNAMKVDRWHR